MRIFKKSGKYLTKEQQIKRAFIKGLLISIILVAAVILTYQFLIIPFKLKEFERNYYSSQDMVTVVKLKNFVPQGIEITVENLTEEKVSKDNAPANALTKSIFVRNKVARIDLAENTILTESMITDKEDKVTDDLRLQDYNHIILNGNLKVGDYVDIRLKLVDGQDFKVATKKRVEALDGSRVYFRIDEIERTNINGATVEASFSENAYLYTTIYVDPENQPKAEVTYAVNPEILKKIEENGKLVEEAQKILRERYQSQQLNNNIDVTDNRPNF